jgi:hypothetical protein
MCVIGKSCLNSNQRDLLIGREKPSKRPFQSPIAKVLANGEAQLTPEKPRKMGPVDANSMGQIVEAPRLGEPLGKESSCFAQMYVVRW